MDLHLTAAKASAEEQAAIDAVLKKLESEPGGAFGQIAMNGHAAFNGLHVHSMRHLLLPLLHAIQERIGWISPGALNYASLRLGVPPAEAHGVASFYEMFSLTPRPPVVAHVCDDIACMTRGAEALCAEVERKLGPAGKPSPDGKAIWQRGSCLGLCERAPAKYRTVAGEAPFEEQLPAESLPLPQRAARRHRRWQGDAACHCAADAAAEGAWRTGPGAALPAIGTVNVSADRAGARRQGAARQRRRGQRNPGR